MSPRYGKSTVADLPMPDTPFIILSQDDCSRCERLKLMLEQPLENRFKDAITVVHRQDRLELFQHLAERYGVLSTPVIVYQATGDVLTDVNSLMEVRRFLEARLVEAI